MHYFFKQHEENFKEWRNSGYQGIPPLGVDFLKHLASHNFKPDLKIGYKIFGIPHHYIPDFLVEYKDGHKEIHETKGLPLLLWLSTRLKQETGEGYFKKLGWRYKVITKGRQAFYNKI